MWCVALLLLLLLLRPAPCLLDQQTDSTFSPLKPNQTQAQAVVEELSGILHCILNTKSFDAGAARDSVLLLLGSLHVGTSYRQLARVFPFLPSQNSSPPHPHFNKGRSSRP